MDLEKMNTRHLQLLHKGHHTHIFHIDNNINPPPRVVKIAQSSSPMSRQAELFANELTITQNLNLPGVRKAIEIGNIEGKPALYLEYVDGVPLKEYCAREKPNLAEMLTIALNITESITALHGANILYKNLNSDHILIDADNQAVLIDFSIAAKLSLTHVIAQSDRLEGNLAYISPEQTGRIRRDIDHRSDLYSLGVVLYEMLSGQLPFTATTTTELIYSHIARSPQPLISLHPGTPEQLSDIVMKLLEKNVEERYQSAYGVTKDLEQCLHQIQKHGQIHSFDLGQNDVSDRFLIPQELYDRQEELELLEQALSRATAGRCEVVMVSGAAGVGKTALVHELKHKVVECGGVFVTGSYDQYQRTIPFNGLNQAFSVLSEVISAHDPKRLNSLQKQLLQTTGEWQELLKVVLPGMQPLISGHDSPLTATLLSTIPSHQKLLLVIHAILRLLSQACKPLVIFLDNTQWADSASLQILKMLAQEKNEFPLLCIGAFKGELQSDNGSTITLPSAEGGLDIPILSNSIHLKCLDQSALQNMVESIVNRRNGETKSLAQSIFNKTSGNPLLTIEFITSLYRDQTLWFDFDARQWCWDEVAIRNKAVMDNVLTSVTLKIEKLSEQTKELLMLAACIGNEFTLEPLATILEQPPDQVRANILEAENEILVVRLNDPDITKEPKDYGEKNQGITRFTFSHERVRQVVYSLMSTRLKRLTHLQLGRMYLSQFSDEALERQIFTVVDQLNEGFKYIKSYEERHHLAKLNLIAGTRARRSGAYKSATWYLNMGLGLLPGNRWQSCYDITLRLFEETIETEYQCCNFSRVHMLTSELTQHVEDDRGRAKACKYQIMAHAAEGNNDQAFTAAITALEVMGIMKREEMPHYSLPVTVSSTEVDTTTIIKASHTLSQEINFDRLLDTFMDIVMENAGAEKGILIIDQNGRMVIQSRGHVGGQKIKSSKASPLVGSDEVPQSVINAVMNTLQAVILGDACQDLSFSQDDYIQKHQARSILALPIVLKARMVGVLYLENNLTPNVFDMAQLQLLNALLTQVGISMENAKLYADLEKKLKELSETQQALLDSRNWLDRLINAIPDPVFVKDREHRFVLLNNAVCDFIGYSREELLGKSDFDVFPKQEADVFWAMDEMVFTTGEQNVNEENFSDSHGKSHTIITRKTLYTDDQGKHYIVGTIQDITERVNLEGQLRQAVKMEAIGNLAGGVAHDFNNMLTAIIGYCDLVLLRTGEDKRLRQDINQIRKAGKSSAELVQQLLAFSRKQMLRPQVFDLTKVVQNTKKMLKRMISEDILLECSTPGDLGKIIADPVLIEQVIMNLCINARHAMPMGGQLTIEMKNVDLDEVYSQQHLEVEAGQYVMLAVSDTGFGMNDETMSHIFEPFFTTKDKGTGTGLGLATVYGIVKQSKGHIAVYSEVGHGTTFKVYLPRAKDDSLLPHNSQTAKDKSKGGTETIILVEDETLVRELAIHILKEYGYTVLSASNGKDALNILEEQSRLPALLVTDVVMPGMGGKELADHVKSRWPEIRTLYISGYTDEAIVRHGVLDSNTEFLQKPFSSEALAEKVRKILDTSVH